MIRQTKIDKYRVIILYTIFNIIQKGDRKFHKYLFKTSLNTAFHYGNAYFLRLNNRHVWLIVL